MLSYRQFATQFMRTGLQTGVLTQDLSHTMQQ